MTTRREVRPRSVAEIRRARSEPRERRFGSRSSSSAVNESGAGPASFTASEDEDRGRSEIAQRGQRHAVAVQRRSDHHVRERPRTRVAEDPRARMHHTIRCRPREAARGRAEGASDGRCGGRRESPRKCSGVSSPTCAAIGAASPQDVERMARLPRAPGMSGQGGLVRHADHADPVADRDLRDQREHAGEHVRVMVAVDRDQCEAQLDRSRALRIEFTAHAVERGRTASQSSHGSGP